VDPSADNNFKIRLEKCQVIQNAASQGMTAAGAITAFEGDPEVQKLLREMHLLVSTAVTKNRKRGDP
jgi:hypothetical protein